MDQPASTDRGRQTHCAALTTSFVFDAGTLGIRRDAMVRCLDFIRTGQQPLTATDLLLHSNPEASLKGRWSECENVFVGVGLDSNGLSNYRVSGRNCSSGVALQGSAAKEID